MSAFSDNSPLMAYSGAVYPLNKRTREVKTMHIPPNDSFVEACETNNALCLKLHIPTKDNKIMFHKKQNS